MPWAIKKGNKIYEKHDFEVEGIRKHAMIVDGQYVDEYYMGKLLE